MRLVGMEKGATRGQKTQSRVSLENKKGDSSMYRFGGIVLGSERSCNIDSK